MFLMSLMKPLLTFVTVRLLSIPHREVLFFLFTEIV